MAYIDNTLTFSDTGIVEDASGIEIVGTWERIIAEKSAEYVCGNKGDVLEIGFGMGMCADYIQTQGVNSHTIVELHPQIIERMRAWAEGKSNVTIIEGDWNTVSYDRTYDGIYHDSYSPFEDDFSTFKQFAIDNTRSGSKITYFSPHTDENTYGFDNISFEELDVDPSEHIWYDKYYMPKVVM
jgi:hypothetical protein